MGTYYPVMKRLLQPLQRPIEHDRAFVTERLETCDPTTIDSAVNGEAVGSREVEFGAGARTQAIVGRDECTAGAYVE